MVDEPPQSLMEVCENTTPASAKMASCPLPPNTPLAEFAGTLGIPGSGAGGVCAAAERVKEPTTNADATTGMR